MATNPMPMPDQGAAPQGGGTPSPSSGGGLQAPANKMQELLAQWSQVATSMAATEPRIAAGMEKVKQGIQEAQTALVTPPQPTPIAQQPAYS